jgi:hypothetical protein
MAGWAVDERGDVILYPVVDLEVAVPYGSSVAVKARFVRNEAERETFVRSQTGERRIQLLLSPQAAREFARLLIEVADIASRGPSPNDPVS